MEIYIREKITNHKWTIHHYLSMSAALSFGNVNFGHFGDLGSDFLAGGVLSFLIFNFGFSFLAGRPLPLAEITYCIKLICKYTRKFRAFYNFLNHFFCSEINYYQYKLRHFSLAVLANM